MCPGLVIAANSPAADKYVDEHAGDAEQDQQTIKETPKEHVLSAGLFPPSGISDDSTVSDEAELITDDEDVTDDEIGFAPVTQQPCGDGGVCESSSSDADTETNDNKFNMEETLFIFDWDDTLLPSTWLQRQGLRLDDGSKVLRRQREQLAEVEATAIELIANAKQHGTVVLVTNAERGWIELSCQKFLPALLPLLENVKAVSARTSYESPSVPSPLDWKVLAFENEIDTIVGRTTLHCSETRKNILSLGDSVHEREAVLRATAPLPNCRTKALKFVEKPDITQISKQHSLVSSCFDRIVNHDGHLDLCLQCT